MNVEIGTEFRAIPFLGIFVTKFGIVSLQWIWNGSYTDKKENQIFLIYKKILSGAVAKSSMRKGFLIYEEIRKYFPMYEEAVSHIWLCNCSTLNFLTYCTCMYEENLIFLFISVERLHFMLLLKVGTREAVLPWMIYVFLSWFLLQQSVFLFRTCKICI